MGCLRGRKEKIWTTQYLQPKRKCMPACCQGQRIGTIGTCLNGTLDFFANFSGVTNKWSFQIQQLSRYVVMLLFKACIRDDPSEQHLGHTCHRKTPLLTRWKRWKGGKMGEVMIRDLFLVTFLVRWVVCDFVRRSWWSFRLWYACHGCFRMSYSKHSFNHCPKKCQMWKINNHLTHLTNHSPNPSFLVRCDVFADVSFFHLQVRSLFLTIKSNKKVSTGPWKEGIHSSSGAFSKHQTWFSIFHFPVDFSPVDLEVEFENNNAVQLAGSFPCTRWGCWP